MLEVQEVNTKMLERVFFRGKANGKLHSIATKRNGRKRGKINMDIKMYRNGTRIQLDRMHKNSNMIKVKMQESDKVYKSGNKIKANKVHKNGQRVNIAQVHKNGNKVNIAKTHKNAKKVNIARTHKNDKMIKIAKAHRNGKIKQKKMDGIKLHKVSFVEKSSKRRTSQDSNQVKVPITAHETHATIDDYRRFLGDPGGIVSFLQKGVPENRKRHQEQYEQPEESVVVALIIILVIIISIAIAVLCFCCR